MTQTSSSWNSDLKKIRIKHTGLSEVGSGSGRWARLHRGTRERWWSGLRHLPPADSMESCEGEEEKKLHASG